VVAGARLRIRLLSSACRYVLNSAASAAALLGSHIAGIGATLMIPIVAVRGIRAIWAIRAIPVVRDRDRKIRVGRGIRVIGEIVMVRDVMVRNVATCRIVSPLRRVTYVPLW
jgi:hypothetical protein